MQNFAFARRQRLLTASAFDRVFRESQRSADRLFTILFAGNDCGHARIGFAISRQKIRRAVGRNRLRRIVRETFRIRCAELPPVDIVVMARDSAKAATNEEIVASLDRHWARMKQPARPRPPAAERQ